MSDEKPVNPEVDETIRKFEEQIRKDVALERLKDEVALKKATIDNQRYEVELETIEQNKKDLEIAKNLDLGKMSQAQVSKLTGDFQDYIDAAKHKFVFLKDTGDTFKRIVPFFRKNLILIAAHTGKGKSTAAANLAYSVITQKNKITGRGGRVLIMTNEEKSEDFYARVICLLNGWNYVNHDELTEEQIAIIKKGTEIFAKNGRLMVIDNDFGGAHGITTTFEGIESIFENMVHRKDFYDLVIIDYYQNVMSSKRDPKMDENRVQTRLSKMLDQYKNIYPAPIVLMAQADPETDHDHRMFKQRINGRKIILDGCTFAVELIVDYTKHATEWTVWKSRYTQFIGKSVFTGFKTGKYVEYTEEFRKDIQTKNDAERLKSLDDQMNKQSANELKEKMEKKDGSQTSD